VEREEEIKNFLSTSAFRIVGDFIVNNSNKLSSVKAELNKRFVKKEDAIAFLQKCIDAQYTIEDVDTKPAKKSPAPPFTTSTLQQEASRKLSFSVANTMRVAQELYESGFITYMRTDSVNLSDMALAMSRNEITASFGPEYVKTRKFATKTKGAQEAHEAIRPTYMTNRTIDGDKTHKRLYELIWKRTIASQMADAELEKTNVTIGVSRAEEKFIAKGEVIKFDGFLKVYMESTDEDEQGGEEGMLPPMNAGDKLDLNEMSAQEKFTQQPFRYTEAMLVKKLEELGIGRPSTYAPIISTIQKRGYVVKEDRPGIQRDYTLVTLKKAKITEEVKSEMVGSEKSKLFPTDIGTLVNNFLVEYFNNILDYNFTASVEEEFDEIAEGRMVWNQMIKDFYFPFHKQIEGTLEKSGKVSGEKLLGKDPKTGENIFVKIGRYGPMVQMGDADAEAKPKFASLKKGQSLDTLSLDEALDLFKLPRTIGEFESSDVVAAIGRFGPYIRHKSLFYSLPKDVDPLTVELDLASKIILAKRESDSQKIIREFTVDKTLIQVLNGRFGAYIACNKENYKIPKGKDPKALTLEDCQAIIAETQPSKSKSKKKK
jgi:DNA topoisomerase-1